AFAVNHGAGWRIEWAWLAALAVTGHIAWAVDRAVFHPMRDRRPFARAIASIGGAFVLPNPARLGPGPHYPSHDPPRTRAVAAHGLRIGREQLLSLAVAVALLALVQLFLNRSRLGVAMRAAADNPLLARIKGLPTERIAGLATLGGGALAGGAGVFLGLDTTIDPLLRTGLIIAVFAAAILAGIGSAPGALVGALVVGIAEELSTMAVPPTYKSAVGFAIMLAVLLVRPRGLFGARA